MRLTTTAGNVLEFEDLDDMLRAVAWLEARAHPVPDVGQGEGSGVLRNAASVHEVVDPVARFARSDGQRRFLQALIASSAPLTDIALGEQLGMDRTKVQGTMGAIFARAAEQGIIATQIVHRDRKKNAAGRRYYEYSAGPLLRSATIGAPSQPA